jgi:hypothetical protein
VTVYSNDELVAGSQVTGLTSVAPTLMEQLAADPRVAGLARDQFSSGVFGGAKYDKLGTANDAWLKLSFGLELLERQVLADPATNVVFSGLRGDYDRQHVLIFSGIKASWNAWLLQPNGSTTGLFSTISATEWKIHNGGWGVGDVHSGFIIINAKTGKIRTFAGFTANAKADGSACTAVAISGLWTDTNTEIASYEIESGAAGGFAAQSIFALYALRSG